MTYYNENDPKAAAWLRELIKAGLIPAGDVDERSILDVKPYELTGYSQQHFFAGIGGWAYALRLAGWPDNRPVRTGSCPCQPFSAAGEGLAEEDERHLWPTFRDLIVFGEPTVTFGEQVASALGRTWLSRVRADLEGLGYGVGAADLCAAGVGAPHIRQRLYWVAHHARLGRRKGARQHGGVDSARGGQSEFTEHRCAGGLADSHGRESGDGKLQRGGKYGQQPEDGRVGGLADSNPDGCGELRTSRLHETGQSGNNADGRGKAGELGDAEQSRLQGYTGDGDDRREPGRINPQSAGSAPAAGCAMPANTGQSPGFTCYWSDFELVPCRDGKTRRIEPGTFPLAHGVSGRVGLLRGYGNAIVPQVAAEFIQAVMEALE